MEKLFLTFLNMSITATYVIIAVLVLRLALYKAPKKYSYALWSVVAFRLCCPISFQSIFSFFELGIFNMSKAQAGDPVMLEYVPENIGMMANPQITTGISVVNTALAGRLPAATPYYSVNPMQVWIFIGMVIWCVGIILLSLYGVRSYAKLSKQLGTAVLLQENIYQSEKISSPFVLGLIRPRIYIPFGLEQEAQSYVLTHERYHIRRKDHIVKLLAYVLLILHWYNPLCWLAFALMSKDMEMSCDEKVLMSEENIRKAYSMTLLSFAVKHPFPSPTPLAFGESSVKSRIKNILNWKKPALWVSVSGLMLCLAAVILCAANPIKDKDVPSALGYVYSAESVVYEDSAAETQANMHSAAKYCLTSNEQLIIRMDNVSWSELTNLKLGGLTEFELSQDNFDRYLSDEGWEDTSASAGKLRRKNLKAWKVITEEQLYYILQQKDGTIYLAWGWYDAEGETDPYSDDSRIVQIFRLAEVKHPDKVLLTDLPDNYTAVDAIGDGCVVFEDGTITGGQAIWDQFVQKCNEGQPAEVRTVTYYYKTDNVHYVHDLYYDGDSYTQVWYEEGERFLRSFKYLVRYEGPAPSPNATFTDYVYYVMVNDPDVTWKELEWGLLSSRMGDYIPHMVVYWYRNYKE